MDMKPHRWLVVAALVAGVSIVCLQEEVGMTPHPTPASGHLPDEGGFPSLAGAIEWINSPPLTPAGLRGKVVLVDVWTLTCINWLRTEPYIRAWAARYKDKGLVVIGVHSPEFEFEKDVANVRRAVNQMRIDYPVAVDSNMAIWQAFHNNYWPALYLIDAKGRIRYHQFGEGEYERTEQVIQQLLAESGASGVPKGPSAVDARGVEAAADWAHLKSQENYVGYEKTAGFASPGGVARDKSRAYAAPVGLRVNQWALSGDWTVRADASRPEKTGGRIVYRFHARDLHLVMGVPSGKSPVRFRVRIDGHPPGPAHGTDVDAEGNGTAMEQRLYQLIRQPGAIEDRQFEIEFLDPGVEAFCFTFG